MPETAATFPSLAKCPGTLLISIRFTPYIQPVISVIMLMHTAGLTL